MTSETPDPGPDLIMDGPATYAALVTGNETVVGPITGWNPYGPCIARLGEDGMFRGFVDSDAHTTSWIGSVPQLLIATAELFVSVHGELSTPVPAAPVSMPKTFPTDPDRLPLALAVDRALTPQERAGFLSQLTSRFNGAEPADWIEAAADEDAFLDVVEEWWDENGNDAIDKLPPFLPLPVARALLLRAVYAWIPLKDAELSGQNHRTVTEIALGAALWLHGYATRAGYPLPEFEPPAPAEPKPPAGQAPEPAPPIEAQDGDLWHDNCPSITGGQLWRARLDGDGRVELVETNWAGEPVGAGALIRADRVGSMRGGMTLIERDGKPAPTAPAIVWTNYMSGREEMEATHIVGPFLKPADRNAEITRLRALPLGAPEFNGGAAFAPGTMEEANGTLGLDLYLAPPSQVAEARTLKEFFALFAGAPVCTWCGVAHEDPGCGSEKIGE